MPNTADFIVDRLRQWGIHRILKTHGLTESIKSFGGRSDNE